MSVARWIRRRKKRQTRPNYLSDAIRLGQHLDPGRIGILVVRHDDDCAHWDGGLCNCQPDTEMEIHESGRSAVDAMKARQAEEGGE